MVTGITVSIVTKCLVLRQVFSLIITGLRVLLQLNYEPTVHYKKCGAIPTLWLALRSPALRLLDFKLHYFYCIDIATIEAQEAATSSLLLCDDTHAHSI